MNIIPIILTIHVLIVLALIGVVLLQRSEGGALGIGGGGGGGFMSGRGAASALTRMTSGLAFLFFATSLGLAMFADQGETASDIVNEITGTQPAANDDGEIGASDLGGIFTGETDDPASTASQDEADTNADPLSSIATDTSIVEDAVDSLEDIAEETVPSLESAVEEATSEEEDPL